MASAIKIVRNLYRDSVSLMQLSSGLTKLSGVAEASIIMASPGNIDLLREAGLVTGAVQASPSDLLIALKGESDAALADALVEAERALREEPRNTGVGAPGEMAPRSIQMALAAAPDATLALISTPGEYAAAEGMKALRLGLNVMLFSDNVRSDQPAGVRLVVQIPGVAFDPRTAERLRPAALEWPVDQPHHDEL